jgi:hypothetical protein
VELRGTHGLDARVASLAAFEARPWVSDDEAAVKDHEEGPRAQDVPALEHAFEAHQR